MDGCDRARESPMNELLSSQSKQPQTDSPNLKRAENGLNEKPLPGFREGFGVGSVETTGKLSNHFWEDLARISTVFNFTCA